MSTPAGLAPDAALPQRDALLDASAMRSTLASRLGVDRPLELDQCERLRVKYRVGESLRVTYRVRAGGTTDLVAARAFPAGASAGAFTRALATAVDGGRLRPVAHDAQLEAVLWTFPNDRKLSSLPALADGRALSELLGTPPLEIQLAAYAPEKSATLACSSGGRTLAYAKVYPDRAGERTARVHETLRDAGLPVPRVLALAASERVLLVEPIRGLALATFEGAALARGLWLLGALLARLHAVPPVDERAFARLDVLRLAAAAELVARARPDAGEAVRRLVDGLTRSSRQADGPAVCLHGDVHLKNVILRGSGVSLIDLDQTSAGPAAAELGSVLAGLRYDRCVGELSPHSERAHAAALLAGYASVAALPSERSLRWHTAAALLAERALRAVNRIRPAGLLHLHTVLGEASELLGADR